MQNKDHQSKQKCLTIAFLGMPNAGKSTLMNSIIGEAIAAVHPKPQMTRHNLLGICTQENTQLIFIDTPGLHQATTKLNQIMVQQLDAAIEEADLVCILLEVDKKVPLILDEYIKKIKTKKNLAILLNKTDQNLEKWCLDPKTVDQKYGLPVIPVSGLTGKGVGDLVKILKKEAKEHPFYYSEDDLTSSTCRELTSEYIREQVMEYLHQEIPYQISVKIESYKEKPNNVSIKAVIIVNKESQKGMVIGKNGKTIDKIRKAAIHKIKKLVQSRVSLSLFVKIEKDWIKNSKKIKELF